MLGRWIGREIKVGLFTLKFTHCSIECDKCSDGERNEDDTINYCGNFNGRTLLSCLWGRLSKIYTLFIICITSRDTFLDSSLVVKT